MSTSWEIHRMNKEINDNNEDCEMYGSVPGRYIGEVFLQRRDLYCIHNTISPIAVGPEGPYSILLLRRQNLNDHGHLVGFNTGETQKFTGDCNAPPEGQFNINLMIAITSQIPVRLIRSAFLNNSFSPARGFRYDGLYRCKAYETDIVKNKLVFKFLLSRIENQSNVPWEIDSQIDTSDRVEITQEPNSNHSVSAREALDFTVSIDESFCLEEEQYRLIGPSESSSFKVEDYDSEYSKNESAVAEESSQPKERKLLCLSPKSTYEVEGDIDNEAVSALMSKLGVISKSLNLPSDYYDNKGFVDDSYAIHGSSSGVRSCVKTLASEKGNNMEAGVVDIYEPNHMKMETDYYSRFNNSNETNSDSSSVWSQEIDPVPGIRCKVEDGTVSTDRESSGESHLSELGIKTETFAMDAVQTIVPSPNSPESSPECRSVIVENDSPLGDTLSQPFDPNSSQNDSLSLAPDPSPSHHIKTTNSPVLNYTVISEDVNTVEAPLPLNEQIIQSDRSWFKEPDRLNYFGGMKKSPLVIDGEECLSVGSQEDIVPTTSLLVVSPESTSNDRCELLKEEVLLHSPTGFYDGSQVAREGYEGVRTVVIDGQEYIMEEVYSANSTPVQSDAEVDNLDLSKWYNDAKTKINVARPSEFQDAGDRISKLEDISYSCVCSPPLNTLEELLGELHPLYAQFFSDFFCKCKPKIKSHDKTQIQINRITEVVESLCSSDVTHVASLFVFLRTMLCRDGETEDRVVSTPKVRKRQGRSKIILKDSNDCEYDLIEDASGKYSLVKQSDNCGTLIPSLVELDSVSLGQTKETPNPKKHADNTLHSTDAITKRPSKIKETGVDKRKRKYRRRNNSKQRLKNLEAEIRLQSSDNVASSHTSGVLLPSRVPKPHLKGFSSPDIRPSTDHWDNFTQVLCTSSYLPPKYFFNFAGFKQKEVKKAQESADNFSQALFNPQLSFSDSKR